MRKVAWCTKRLSTYCYFGSPQSFCQHSSGIRIRVQSGAHYFPFYIYVHPYLQIYIHKLFVEFFKFRRSNGLRDVSNNVLPEPYHPDNKTQRILQSHPLRH